ncbi:pirin family protein [Jatrophihabitans sp.]|uniref:pirin family protein n=1 Tax=Jatrophihabitans sp. TaxID=1932789 RepID=UPI002CD4B096|nr:pirin family protein [Jatrophihabitans sp.]
MSTFEIRRGADRASTRTEWLDSRHSFAFGPHYDPDNIGFGVLVAHNADILQPGPGYPVHAHRDVEILTWVVAGTLAHSEADGAWTVIGAGQLHYVAAGSGIRHTELSADDQPVQVVQMWLTPDEFGLPPASRLLRPEDRLASGELVEVASGAAQAGADGVAGVLRIRQRAAALSVAKLPAGRAVTLPDARYLHLYLTAGSVTYESGDGEQLGELAAGDALRITSGGGLAPAAEQAVVPGGEPAVVRAGEPTELLVWRMQAGIGAAAGQSTYPG